MPIAKPVDFSDLPQSSCFKSIEQSAVFQSGSIISNGNNFNSIGRIPLAFCAYMDCNSFAHCISSTTLCTTQNVNFVNGPWHVSERAFGNVYPEMF